MYSACLVMNRIMLTIARVIYNWNVYNVHNSTYWVQTSSSRYVLGMYSDCLVMNRLMWTIARVMYTRTSTFWSQAGLSLFTILLPYWPCQIHRHPCHSGSSTVARVLVVQKQQRRMAGVAATTMRSTRGCDSLDVASLAWAAWQSRRLRIGRILPAMRQTSVRRRQVTASKGDGALNEVWVGFVCICTRTNKVRTFHPKYLPSTYYFPRVRPYTLVCTLFTKILHWMLFYVVCLWETILCVRDMYVVVLQYRISAPIGVQHTWHYFGTYSVCTGMYQSIQLYISCTCLYLVRISMYRFRTGTC
jgi:hypothetical protein